MDKEQAQAFRLQLLAQRREVLAQLAHLRATGNGRDAAAGEPEPTLDEQETAALSQIDAALKRMEAGVYGECMDCGLAIPPQRLQATPQALRCATCQEIAERDGARSTY